MASISGVRILLERSGHLFLRFLCILSFFIWFDFSILQCFGGMHEGSIKIVEMLFSTSLVAIVGVGDQPDFSPRKLHLWSAFQRDIGIRSLEWLSGIKEHQELHKHL